MEALCSPERLCGHGPRPLVQREDPGRAENSTAARAVMTGDQSRPKLLLCLKPQFLSRSLYRCR
jgi:hypothetical protein